MKYNLGAGDLIKEGYVSVDMSEKCNPDIVADITQTPWDWMEEADEIRLDNIAEHLYPHQLINVLNECHKKMKKGGKLWLRSPLVKLTEENLTAAFTDPTHVNYFTIGTFSYWLDEDYRPGVNRWQMFGKDYGIIPWSSGKIREWENNSIFLIVELIK